MKGWNPRKIAEGRFEVAKGQGISMEDWVFVDSVLYEFNIHSILEFGSGFSTIRFAEHPIIQKIVSYDENEDWAQCLREQEFPADTKVEIRSWDRVQIKEKLTIFDLAFVDGPAQGQNREMSTKIASEHAMYVLVHDAFRMPDLDWQLKYLAGRFDLIKKGGLVNQKSKGAPYCHLWSLKPEMRRIHERDGEVLWAWTVPKQKED